MPKYDYVCMACDKTVELMIPFGQSDHAVCETCGGFMIKAFTPPAIHFKGGGWGGSSK